MQKPAGTGSGVPKPALQPKPAPPSPSLHPIEAHFAKISRYHYYIFTFLFLSKIPVFWHFVTLIFLNPPMTYTCKSNKQPNFCPCDEPVWDTSVFSQTVQTRFGIICEKSKLLQPSNSLLYVGALIGSFSFGFMSDKYGRLTMFVVSCTVLATAGCLVALMPNFYLYMLARVVEGAGIGGAIVTGYVLCVEYCGVKNRALITALYHVPLNVGHMTIAGVSFLLRNYVHMQLAVSIPIYLFVIMYWLCLESPKWYMDSQKIDKAAEIMTKIAKFNNTSYGDIKGEMQAYQAIHAGDVNAPKAKFTDIFKYRKLVINFSCMSVIFFACGLGYYGVSQYIGQMSGNIHENVAISGALLIPATLSCIVLLHYLSRKTFLIITSISSGGLLLVCVLIIPPSMQGLSVFIASISNCCFFMSFIIVFLYGVELFPTSVRNSVLGVLAVMSRVGQIIAPLVNQWPAKVSGCIFGGIAVIGGIICIPLPETKNKELPSSLEAYATKPAASNAPAGQGVNIK